MKTNSGFLNPPLSRPMPSPLHRPLLAHIQQTPASLYNRESPPFSLHPPTTEGQPRNLHRQQTPQ